MTTDVPNISAIANWFGSSRMVAHRIGPELAGRPHVTIPFAGGMPELPYIEAAKLVVNDRHRHVINLARVIASPATRVRLYAKLKRTLFHPDELRRAQDNCRLRDECDGDADTLFATGFADPRFEPGPDVNWAADYFIATWMGRGGKSGTRGEFKGELPIRFSPNGGGSAQRFVGAVRSLAQWGRVLRRCEFSTDDALDVIAACHDSPRCGLYCDPPWPDAGDEYAQRFTVSSQRRLATALGRFTQTRLVVRFADHPLIRELYPRERWTWLTYPSRAQTNGSFDEVLILNGPSAASAPARAVLESPRQRLQLEPDADHPLDDVVVAPVAAEDEPALRSVDPPAHPLGDGGRGEPLPRREVGAVVHTASVPADAGSGDGRVRQLKNEQPADAGGSDR